MIRSTEYNKLYYGLLVIFSENIIIIMVLTAAANSTVLHRYLPLVLCTAAAEVIFYRTEREQKKLPSKHLVPTTMIDYTNHHNLAFVRCCCHLTPKRKFSTFLCREFPAFRQILHTYSYMYYESSITTTVHRIPLLLPLGSLNLQVARNYYAAGDYSI